MSLDFKKQQNSKIILIGSLVIAGLLLFFVIYPAIKNIKNLATETSTMKTDLEIKKKTNSLSDTLQLYNVYEKKLNTLHSSLLTKNRELEFVTTLERIASNNNLAQKITLNEYEPVETDIQFSSMAVQIWLEGDFVNVLNYLQDIERLPFYININNIKINTKKIDQPDQEEKITVSNVFITANTYWQ